MRPEHSTESARTARQQSYCVPCMSTLYKLFTHLSWSFYFAVTWSNFLLKILWNGAQICNCHIKLDLFWIQIWVLAACATKNRHNGEGEKEKKRKREKRKKGWNEVTNKERIEGKARKQRKLGRKYELVFLCILAHKKAVTSNLSCFHYKYENVK